LRHQHLTNYTQHRPAVADIFTSNGEGGN